MTMTLKNYLDLIADRVEEAGARGDHVEAIRLLRLGKDVLSDKIDEIERKQQQQQQQQAGGMRLGQPEVGRVSSRESNLKEEEHAQRISTREASELGLGEEER